MSTSSRVIKNTGFLYMKMGITVFISLYTTRLILNSLGASDFGVFNVVGGAIAMLAFLNTAMASATQRFMSFSEGEGNLEKRKQQFNISILLHLIIAIIVVAIMECFYFFLFNGILNIDIHRIYAAKMIYQFLVISTMFTIMTVPYDAVLNARENMLYYALVGIVESILKLLVAIYVMYTSEDKLIVYGFLMASISLVIMIAMRVYNHKKYDECQIDIKRYYNKSLMKEMTFFAGWNLIGSASSIIAGYGSGIILNHFFGTVLNTVNGISGQLNGQLLTFSNTLQKALSPVITKSEGGGNRELMKRATLTGTKLSFLLFAIISIPFLIDTQYILKLWLKNIPEWSVVFCRLFVVFTLIEQLTRTFSTAIAATGKIKYVNVINSVVLILSVLALYLVFAAGLSPVFLPVLAIITALVFSILNIVFVKKYCSIGYKDYFENVFFRVFIVFSISYIIGLLPNLYLNESFIRLVLTFLSSVITFIITSFYIGLDQVEQQIVVQLFCKIKKYINK
ncbi:MAG: flippase [Sphingobacteriales bacterium]|nr:flippase [Sphingobacteriales bacterium]